VSGFSAEWLALREPADVAARSAAVTSFVTGALAHHSLLRIVDLGSGTGSNVRYLSRYLPQVQRWQLMDNDATLLAPRSLLTVDVETRVATCATWTLPSSHRQTW
jgi:trans-aconitate methyltransferase